MPIQSEFYRCIQVLSTGFLMAAIGACSSADSPNLADASGGSSTSGSSGMGPSMTASAGATSSGGSVSGSAGSASGGAPAMAGSSGNGGRDSGAAGSGGTAGGVAASGGHSGIGGAAAAGGSGGVGHAAGAGGTGNTAGAGGQSGNPKCGPDITFFQNDWDGNDSDGANCSKAYDVYDLYRFATSLKDVKNPDAPMKSLDLANGAQKIADATKQGKVALIMGGGAGQMEMLVNAVAKLGGTLANITVFDHGAANRANLPGGTGQYGDTSSWARLQKLVKTISIPNQNSYAYGPINGVKSTDVSDFGLLHYVCYGEDMPTVRRLFL